MERFTIATNVNVVLSNQRSDDFDTDIPISFPVKPNNKHRQRDPSFESFLRPENPTPPRTVDPEIGIFGAERYFNDQEQRGVHGSGRNALLVHDRPVCGLPSYVRGSSVSSLDGYGKMSRDDHHFRVALPTTTASSEVSWNSRSGFLSNLVDKSVSSPREHAKGPSPSSSSASSSSACKWLFCWSCPCSGKKSVGVEENFAEPKSPNTPNFDSTRDGSSAALERRAEAAAPTKNLKIDLMMEEMTKLKLVSRTNWTMEEGGCQSSSTLYTSRPRYHRIISSTGPFNDANGGFSFPILIKPTSEEDPPRDSLEVFHPKDDSITTTRKTTTDFHFWRPATPPSPPLNTSRRSFASPVSPKGRANRLEDDIASDSSSDLFEIESFSASQMTAFYRRRDSLDEILETGRFPEEESGPSGILTELARSSDAPSEFCPPSEVSVTTAEGFDKAAAASDNETATFRRQETTERSRRKGNGRLLTSCICQKAVNVGPHPVRRSPERGKVELTEVERVTGNGGGGVPLHGRPPLARSNSERMSRPIQTRYS